MKSYRLKASEKVPFTHLFILTKSDFSVGFSNKQITLAALNVGDVVFPGILQEIKTYVTGPTGAPTASLGVTGAGTQFTAASSVVSAASKLIVPGEAVPPYAANAATNLIVDLQVGGGDGAAATAGELWFWVQMSLASDRSTQA